MESVCTKEVDEELPISEAICSVHWKDDTIGVQFRMRKLFGKGGYAVASVGERVAERVDCRIRAVGLLGRCELQATLQSHKQDQKGAQTPSPGDRHERLQRLLLRAL